jgi:hypothetical protein
MRGDDLKEKVAAIKELTELFRFERYVYASVITVCLGLLVFSVGMAIKEGKNDGPEVAGMLSSSGGAMFAIGRLLKMWNRAMSMLDGRPEDGKS